MIYNLLGINIDLREVQAITTPYLYKESYHSLTVVVFNIMFKGAFSQTRYTIPLIDGEIINSDVSSDYIALINGKTLWIDSNGMPKENIHNVKPLTGTKVGERIMPIFNQVLNLL